MVRDAETLLDQVYAAPDDDAPRLIYADWLIQRGDPLGELIQIQCRLAAAPDDAKRRALRISENRLLNAHQTTWLAPALATVDLATMLEKPELSFERGFIATAKLSQAHARLFPNLIEKAPLIRSLRLLRDREEQMTFAPVPVIGDTFADPAFGNLRSLELDLQGGGNALARDVAASRQLANLTSLAISASVWGEQVEWYRTPAAQLALDDEGAIALAQSPYLRQVTHLRLARNRIGLAGLRAIANAPWRLETLDLSSNTLGADLINVALEGPATASLVTLNLDATAIAPTTIAGLAKSKAFPNLRDLTLESCGLGPLGIEAFCKLLALPALRYLRLDRNGLNDAGAHTIAGCATFAQLTALEAGHNRFGAKGGAAIASSPYLANLERLTLNEPRWKPEMTQLFATSQTLAKTKIYLGGKLVSRKPAKRAAKQ